VLVEYLGDYLPVKGEGPALAPGCSQLVARGAATADGRIYHARILDWGDIDYLLEFPVIFVREPAAGNPHVTIGFPGNLSPYTGMSWHGLSIGSNESDPLDGSQHDLVGRSHVQMTARLLASELYIVSRAVDSNAVPKLERAGANRAISPYAIGGRRMAHLILSPHVVDFFETALHRGNKTLSIGEIQVLAGSSAIGASLDALRKRASGATVLAVLRSHDGSVALATDNLVLAGGDHLLALGTDEQLEALETSLAASV